MNHATRHLSLRPNGWWVIAHLPGVWSAYSFAVSAWWAVTLPRVLSDIERESRGDSRPADTPAVGLFQQRRSTWQTTR